MTTLLDQVRLQAQSQDRRQFDLVEDFNYPLPVPVISRILGVPCEDEPQFKVWASAFIESIAQQGEAARRQGEQAANDLNQYIAGLIKRHRKQPGDDLLSLMAIDDGPEGGMTDRQLVATGVLLLIAGHETTVNLLGNGILALLRHPAILDRLRSKPDLIPLRCGGDAAL